MIEFQYFDGCPNAVETLRNLRELISEGLISESDIVVKKIPDIDSAEKYHFQGSPTILINGVDIYTELTPSGFNYSCRVYQFEGERTGTIPRSFIKDQIIKFVVKRKDHWEKIYSTKAVDTVSWFQEHAETSLRLIQATGLSTAAAIIDVGGGASTLTDDLLSIGYTNLTVLDVSPAALSAAKHRLGPDADKVAWMEADITTVELPVETFDIWHDRAVFHFLTSPQDRHDYRQSVSRSIKPAGHVIVATFAEDGPTRCSGLPVMRYTADELAAAMGSEFTMLHSEKVSHRTPTGAIQQFVYCHLQKTGTNLYAGTNSYGVWKRALSEMVTSVGSAPTDAPKQFSLGQNYPNPFNPSTTISFSIPSRLFVSLKVFDVMGRGIATLASDVMSSGNHTCRWNASGMPSGVYFYRLQAGSHSETKRLILLR